MDRAKITNSIKSTLPSERLVYLFTQDFLFVTHISQQITHFGYAVQHVRSIKNLQNAFADPGSVAVIVDISSVNAELDESSIFSEILALQHHHRNLIFTSNHDSQAVRLKSIQAGGVAFFTKPINVVSLIDKLDSLDRQSSHSYPSRILIIENQAAVASYYQMVLKMSGYDTQIVMNYDHILEQLREYNPDLILMNTFLSAVNASDMVRVIRQADNYVSIPIIFLSNEDDFGKRIEALDLGGDDFLIKPVKASHLIAVVRTRLERSKILRSYMVRDSLTNLFNHTTFRNILTQEVNRCKRQNTFMALAMLDIDHFKRVNDTYGHATGDSALKGLSRLLQQRLRKSDIVGRYGGDEFVALLIDCEAEQALRVMDEIRVHFSAIEFYAHVSKPLSLTFSCGISTFPMYQSAESLSDSADQALYIAKANRRNSVFVAQS